MGLVSQNDTQHGPLSAVGNVTQFNAEKTATGTQNLLNLSSGCKEI